MLTMISPAPVGSVLSLLLAVLAFVGFSRPSQPEPDVEQRIADLTLKVRHPWKARAQSVKRKRLMGIES